MCSRADNRLQQAGKTVADSASKNSDSETEDMSLKPKRVEFDKIWPDVLKTIQSVITCGPCERHTWNERFRYPSFESLLSDFWSSI